MPSYLLGSMHILPGDQFRGIKTVKNLVADCEVLVNEMDLKSRVLMDPMTMRMEQHLSKHLEPKKYDKLRRILIKAFSIDIETIGYFKPLIISNMLSEVVLGHAGMIGMDEYLFDFAKSIKKPTLGVERVEEQARIMQAIPLQYQIKSLLDIGKNVQAFRRKVLKLNQLFMNHELARLHRVAKGGLGEMRKILLYDRNINMANEIARMIVEQSSFVTIGAGHLYGGKGVLRLLKHRDVSISPISI